MKTACLIPARLASVRFPEKMLQNLGGKPLILRTYEAVAKSGVFDETWVATDSEKIESVLKSVDARVFMSRKSHESGSDRIAELAQKLNTDVVVNVQGDEPFITHEPLQTLVSAFDDPMVEIASLMRKESTPGNFDNPNTVKVVTDKNRFALYFSRAAIPHSRDKKHPTHYFAHIGVYAYRVEALLRFTQMAPSPLETTEKLEQLRMLENGLRIKMVETDFEGIGIDTPEDLKKAEQYLNTLK